MSNELDLIRSEIWANSNGKGKTNARVARMKRKANGARRDINLRDKPKDKHTKHPAAARFQQTSVAKYEAVESQHTYVGTKGPFSGVESTMQTRTNHRQSTPPPQTPSASTSRTSEKVN
jgi:hypothetical protein